MIEYKKFFTERIPEIISTLATNYTKTNNYLNLDDLKRRIFNDTFIISRALQRFMLTMALDNLNTPNLNVYSRISWLNGKAKEVFHAVDEAETEETLAAAVTSLYEEFQTTKEDFIEMINQHDTAQPSIYGYRDITNIRSQVTPFRIPLDIWEPFTHQNRYVNMFLPFDDVDHSYIDHRQFLNVIMSQWNEALHLYGFSFYNEEWRNRYYKYLEKEWTRCDIRYGTFDSVFLTHRSAFVEKSGYYKRALNYVKPGGTIIIYGLRSDFLPGNLDKLASTLDTVYVRFFTHVGFLDREAACKNDIVVLIGRKGHPSDYKKAYRDLLTQFLEGISNTGPLTFAGSDEDVTPFRSYELTENEYTQLIPHLAKTEQEAMNILFHKTEKDLRRPLLPFSSGQLGLVLISGDVNGVIEEQDTLCRHAVKGFSSRTSTSRTEPVLNPDGVEIGYKEITVNYPVTSVNVVLSNGDIREIGG